MKKASIFLLVVIFCNNNFAQWSPSLTLHHFKSFADISAPSDKVIWAITNDFMIYKTSDEGSSWNKIHPKGLNQNISVLQLYAINNATAFLSVNTDFTGIGPGIIYRTIDGGLNWTKVFTHPGNCKIKMGMFNNFIGLMSCSFSSFNGSVKSGQQLYYTIDGGNSWNLDPVNPSNDYYIVSFVVNGFQVAMSDFNYVYFSCNAGLTWTKSKQKVFGGDLQFVDSSYAIVNSGALINLWVKRPYNRWINEGDPSGVGGALLGLVLDGNECWFGMGLDTKNNYYSSDSAKTFTPFIADSSEGFVMMTKARKGKTIIGVTPFFGSATLWMNPRHKKGSFVNEVNIASSSENKNFPSRFIKQTIKINNVALNQNMPNPFSQITTINYSLPEKYLSAKIIITDKTGKLLKEENISGNKGSLKFNASDFTSGIYQYSLYADGRLIDTKQMIITK